jgi:hypothetical protein
MIFPITFLMKTFSTIFTNLWKKKFSYKPFPKERISNFTHGLKFWWIRICVFNVDERLNALPHTRHACGFSDVWMILWRQSVDACRKPFPHIYKIILINNTIQSIGNFTLQINGRIPVCTGICRTKLYWAVKIYLNKRLTLYI